MKKILFADPNRDLLKCYEALLKGRGYDVTTVFDGVQVIEKISENRYDLALLSDVIPRIGAVKLIPLLHEKEIPVLLLVSNSSAIPGVDEWLAFPFVPNEMYAVLSQMLPTESDEQEGEPA